MASHILGKRTRASREADLEPKQEQAAKRPRRTLRGTKINDTTSSSTTITTTIHQDASLSAAAATALDLEDQENQENQAPSPEASQSDDSYTKHKPAAPPNLEGTTFTQQQKRRVVVAPVTPQTPRHYDVFARTPTSTPRHRVMSVGKLSRRLAPQTPLTPSACQTIYHQARQLFSRSADPGQLTGREAERAGLRKFLDRCATANPSGCIYVSGPPGTGKSAMIKEVTQEVVAVASSSGAASIRSAHINCMSIKSSKDLYTTLLDQLSDGIDMSEAEADAAAALEKLLIPRGKKSPSDDVFLVVLDEIDHILTLDMESLYRVFEWSLQKTSRLVLVGIANALDLTDRFLPRLKARSLKPEVLPFLPYTAPQIRGIITTRLQTLLPPASKNDSKGFIPFFHPAAIELCARKVATQTGDLRRAFEICRRALDLVESETRTRYENEMREQQLLATPTATRRVLGENANLASSSSSPSLTTKNSNNSVSAQLQALTAETAPRVSIGHLNKVTAAAFGNGTSQRLKTLNLQQKAALCALVAMERRNRAALALRASSSSSSSSSTDSMTPIPSTPSSSSSSQQATIAAPTVKALFDAYARLCTRDAVLHPLSRSEFREVVGSLETLSLVAPVVGRAGSFAMTAASAAAATDVTGSAQHGGGGMVTTPGGRKRRGRKPALGDAYSGAGGGLLGDEGRIASCVGDREIEVAVEGMGAGILRSILCGEALED